MRRSGLLLIVLVALAAAVPAPTNALGVTARVVADCNAHGRLTGHYSEATLHTALNTLPTDVAEYTNCADVIRKQLLAQVGDPNQAGVSSGGGSGGSFLPTWVIVLLVVVVLGGSGAALAARRRGPASRP
ncbi:MAG: hypothetical protein M3Z06_15925 [Actinomycetota bacterium]|nr:hypothetical protein [Actinomycetota bacterium]